MTCCIPSCQVVILRQFYSRGCKHFRPLLRKEPFSISVSFRNMSTVPKHPVVNNCSRPSHKMFIHLSNDQSRPPYTISENQEELITRGDPEARYKLKECLLALYSKRVQGADLPSTLSVQEFQDLLKLGIEEIDFWLCNCSGHRYKDKPKEEEDRLKADTKSKLHKNLAMDPNSYLCYDMTYNSLIQPLLKHCMSHFFNTNLAKGLLFGQQVVFDCSYDAYMSEIKIEQTASDIYKCIDINRRDMRPFGLHMCNVNTDCRLMYYLQRKMPDIGSDLPVNIYSSSYLKLFEREQIVYLTPHANRELQYHPDDVYVLGAFTPSPNYSEPLSLKKAYADGVRYARLPFGFKNLFKKKSATTLCEAIENILAKKNTGKWKDVPHRSST